MTRKFNFNPGPATLPLSVIETVRDEFVDYKQTGMSIVEMSHRSKEFSTILKETKETLVEVMGLSSAYDVLFLGSGASMQFAMIPMNFLGENETADYVNTGTWANKAIKEAQLFGNVNVAGSSKEDNYSYIPEDLKLTPDAKYIHVTSNNTVSGTQWNKYPETNTPLVVDMSSDIMSRKIDMNKFSLIYAGAQKNSGPAGVTLVIVRKDMLEKVVTNRKIPTMLKYQTHIEKDSSFNTPPVFPIYMVGLVAKWVKEMGGVEKIEEVNNKKANLLYDTIDSLPDFYKGTVKKSSRSFMNVTFRLPSEDLEKKFIAEAAEINLHGLKGHRSVGGIRASIYNALPLEGVEALVDFMKKFCEKNK